MVVHIVAVKHVKLESGQLIELRVVINAQLYQMHNLYQMEFVQLAVHSTAMQAIIKTSQIPPIVLAADLFVQLLVPMRKHLAPLQLIESVAPAQTW